MSLSKNCDSASAGDGSPGVLSSLSFAVLLSLPLSLAASAASSNGTVRGAELRVAVVDADTKSPLAARVYLQGSDGRWHFATSSAEAGTAVRYDKRRPPGSEEVHTTVSAHPFQFELPEGRYTLTVERGKEYHSATRTIDMTTQPQSVRLPLQRWIDMAQQGWYSGDTHVHRTLEELPNLMLAEDVNVAFPLLYWVTRAFEPPSRGDKTVARPAPPRLISVDDLHVMYPRNTEFEIFTVQGQRHMLGAVFVLNHQRELDFGVPPLRSIAAARDADPGALLELDKHNWPWSMALPPLLKVDLFELSNNHVWRAPFAFTTWAEPAPAYMGVAYDGTAASTESGWVHFGFQNYYALLNCGFPMQPTAGTGSGVHPVPLGFGRVYVHLEDGFDYAGWVEGLRRGRSFVTTGPMLFAKVNGEHPGRRWTLNESPPADATLEAEVRSSIPITRIEWLLNGEVVQTETPESPEAGKSAPAGQHRYAVRRKQRITESSWLAVRCYEQRPDGRIRFAHSAPWHFEIQGRPLRPRKAEIDYLMARVEQQIERSRDVLPEEAIAEYQRALSIYREIAKRAR